MAKDELKFTKNNIRCIKIDKNTLKCTKTPPNKAQIKWPHCKGNTVELGPKRTFTIYLTGEKMETQ